MSAFRTLTVLALLSLPCAAFAAETDQFMVWDKELSDSGPALNRFLNEEAEEFIRKTNASKLKIETVEDLSREFYFYLFEWLFSSRVRKFVWESDQVERYPTEDVNFFEYQRQSIFRDLTVFPVVLPMARTIRVGDVYLGVDKIGHFFGFGRRYFMRYTGFRAEGLSEEDAMRRMVEIGIKQENSLVGGLMDGIYSHADLEANFQGFRMARSLAEDGVFVKDGEDWRVAKPLDIVPFITPDMDESWNNSHFQRRRKKVVIPLIAQEYCDLRNNPVVQARFERYAQHKSSFSKDVIADYFMERRGRHPQQVQSLENIFSDCCEPGRQAMASAQSQSHTASASICQ